MRAVPGCGRAVRAMQSRRRADDDDVERPDTEETIEIVAGGRAARPSHCLRAAARRSVDGDDVDVGDRGQRACMRGADVAGADQSDADIVLRVESLQLARGR